MAAFNVGVDTGLWKLMAKNGSQPQKVDDRAQELKIDPVLLGAYAWNTLLSPHSYTWTSCMRFSPPRTKQNFSMGPNGFH